jgi:hypothetical protein
MKGAILSVPFMAVKRCPFFCRIKLQVFLERIFRLKKYTVGSQFVILRKEKVPDLHIHGDVPEVRRSPAVGSRSRMSRTFDLLYRGFGAV